MRIIIIMIMITIIIRVMVMCINQCKYLLNPFSDALLHWLYHPLTLLPLSKRVSIR